MSKTRGSGHTFRVMAATAGWSLAFTCITVGTILGLDEHPYATMPLRWLACGLFLGQASLAMTAWIIVDCAHRRSRARTTWLAKVMAAEAAKYLDERQSDDGTVVTLHG